MSEHRSLILIAALVVLGTAWTLSPGLALFVLACAGGCGLARVSLRQAADARRREDRKPE